MNTAAAPIEIPDPRFEDKPALVLVGLQSRYRCDDKSGIPGQWDAFLQRVTQIGTRVSEAAYGLCTNATETEFDYFCGVEVPSGSPIPDSFATISIPAQRYAVFQHRGRVERIVDTVHSIFTLWLPRSECNVTGEPDLIERYSEDFEPVSNSGSVEIWIPIRA
jgi:AraC family transcriptional regulator